MDGGRRAHLDAPEHRDATDRSVASPTHRCGWCGLLPLPEDQTRAAEHQLCGVCRDILRGVDWRRMLREGQCMPAIDDYARLQASQGS
jgi:hypothetical protein